MGSPPNGSLDHIAAPASSAIGSASRMTMTGGHGMIRALRRLRTLPCPSGVLRSSVLTGITLANQRLEIVTQTLHRKSLTVRLPGPDSGQPAVTGSRRGVAACCRPRRADEREPRFRGRSRLRRDRRHRNSINCIVVDFYWMLRRTRQPPVAELKSSFWQATPGWDGRDDRDVEAYAGRSRRAHLPRPSVPSSH